MAMLNNYCQIVCILFVDIISFKIIFEAFSSTKNSQNMPSPAKNSQNERPWPLSQ